MTRPACLELSVTADIKLTYLLRDDTDILTHLNAEWADVHGEEVLYSIGGKLLCSRIKTSGKRIVYEPPVELGDFSDMTFEPIKAPAAALVW